MLKIRAGIGYDIHRIEKGDGLYIGGIKVCDNLKFIAHSDGDVLIHALIDSLFGAIGERDIGEIFPNSDPKYKNIKSVKLLKHALKVFNNKNFEIINIDCVLILNEPKISSFKGKIRNKIASILNIPKIDFNLKAKTKEIIGDVDRVEAIECFCISMVRFKS